MREAPSRRRRRRDVEAVREGAQRGFEAPQFLEVQRAEVFEALGALRGQLEPDLTLVDGVGPPPHQARGDSAVDQFHGAVVAQQQVAGDVAHGRTFRVAVAADREHQLVLRGRQPCSDDLLLAPTEEAPQPGSETEQPLVVVTVERAVHPDIVAPPRDAR